MDIQTSLKSVDVSFDQCLQMAPRITIQETTVPVLHINHLIANKKTVNRPKDNLDIIELERIKKLKSE